MSADIKEIKNLLIQFGISNQINPSNPAIIPENAQNKIEELLRKIDEGKIPVDTDFLIIQGNYFYHLGEYEKAIEIYDQVILYDEQNIFVLHNKGLALESLGKYEEAITWYDKALEIEPDNDTALSGKREALKALQ
ncbi:MAG: tetratricopeptide repeat protein [Nitrosopumilus sp.]